MLKTLLLRRWQGRVLLFCVGRREIPKATKMWCTESPRKMGGDPRKKGSMTASFEGFPPNEDVFFLIVRSHIA